MSCSANDAVHCKVTWREITSSGPPIQRFITETETESFPTGEKIVPFQLKPNFKTAMRNVNLKIHVMHLNENQTDLFSCTFSKGGPQVCGDLSGNLQLQAGLSFAGANQPLEVFFLSRCLCCRVLHSPVSALDTSVHLDLIQLLLY